MAAAPNIVSQMLKYDYQKRSAEIFVWYTEKSYFFLGYRLKYTSFDNKFQYSFYNDKIILLKN